MQHAIYSKNIITPRGTVEGTIIINNGKIVTIAQQSPAAVPCEDASELVVMPGLIDSHVHINEPGRTDWEGFQHATKAAAAGGITSLIEMPLNASPVTTSPEAFEAKLAATQGNLYVNCGFWGGVVPGNAHHLEALLNAGVWGFKAFLVHSGIDDFPAVSQHDLQQAMPIIAKLGVPLLAHAELDLGPESTQQLVQTPQSYQAYLRSRPKSWEDQAVAMLAQLAGQYSCQTHIVHVSSSQAIPIIQRAKAAGIPLTAETCTHYLYFDAEHIPDGGTIYKCAPPIREKDNNLLLWQALTDGVLDFVVTDHSPSPPGMKDLDGGSFANAWGGISGLQWSLPAFWAKASKKQLPIAKLVQWMASDVAAFVGLEHRKGAIAPGMDADLVIWDPYEEISPKAQGCFSRHPISPYLGQPLLGAVKKTYVNGQLAYDISEFGATPYGELLLRTS